MLALGASEVLALWDAVSSASPLERGLVMARATADGVDRGAAERLTLGQVNADVLRLRGDLFGPQLSAAAPCPACDEQAEFSLDVADLCQVQAKATEERVPVRIGGWIVTWRSATTADLIEAARAGNGDGAAVEAALLNRCLVDVRRRGDAADALSLPPEVRTAVADAITAADPLAEVVVDLGCPACGAPFSAEVDVVALVWAEIDVLARGLMFDVDALARVYGWSETDILRLTDARRAAYVDLVEEAG